MEVCCDCWDFNFHLCKLCKRASRLAFRGVTFQFSRQRAALVRNGDMSEVFFKQHQLDLQHVCSLMRFCLQVMELMVFSWARSSTHQLSCIESSTQQLCPGQAVKVRGCIQLPLRLSPMLGTLHQCQLRCTRGDSALWLIHVARWVGHVAHPFFSNQQV